MFFGIVNIQTLSAQQPFNWNLGYVPHFRNVRDVEIHNNALFAVGGWESNDSIASIFSSTDNGQNWNFITDNINAIIEDIDFVGGNGYAVGWSGNFWKSINDGASWESIPMTGILSNRDFNDCYWLDQNNGIAVGGKFLNTDTLTTIAMTQDGGNSWTMIMDQSGDRLNSVVFLNNQNGFAVGDNGLAYQTIDGGMNWSPMNLPISNRNFNEISFSYGSNIGLVVGGWPDNDSISTIIRTTDIGSTWNIIQDGLGSEWQGMCWVDDHQCCLVGDDGHINWTNDGGVNWNEVIVDVDNDMDWHDVHFVTPGKALFGGASGKFMLAIDPVNSVSSIASNHDFYFDSYHNYLYYRTTSENHTESFNLSVYNQLGAVVLENKISANHFPYHLELPSAGCYFVKMKNQVSDFTIKIIKE